MTTLAVGISRRTSGWTRTATRTDRIALTTLVVLLAGLCAATWGSWGDLGRDTGYDLVAGSRVAHGDVPYADFIYYYGPLAPGAMGLMMWIAGASLGAAQALGIVVSAAIVAVTYALARTQVSIVPAFATAATVAAVAFEPTNLSYVLPHTLSAPFALLTSMLVVLAAARFAATGQRASLVAAGVSAGLVALTRPEFELAVIVAVALWLALRMRSGQSGIRDLVTFATPALVIPAVVYGSFLTAVSAHRLVLDNLYPVDQLRVAGNHVLRIHAPLTLRSFADLAFGVVLYAVGAGALVLLGLVVARLDRRRGFALAVAVALAAVTASVLDPEALRTGLRYSFAWIPAGAAAALALAAMHAWRRRAQWHAVDQTWLLILGILAVLGAKTYAAFFFFGPTAQPAVYAAPFAIIFLARMHMGLARRHQVGRVLAVCWLCFIAAAGTGLTVKDASAKSVVLRGPGGSIAVSPSDAALYRPALAAIAQNTRSGEAILIAPQLTALYVLAGRTDPLPELSLLPGALAGATAERAAIARLERAHVRLVLTDRHRFTEYGATTFGGSFDRVLAAWVRRSFVHRGTLGSAGTSGHVIDIWLRRAT